ncbi:MAG: rod shape-determining protein MreD [Clostridium butyricum]|nr:rod shape-determining protein MreD [Clostridium butyricum]
MEKLILVLISIVFLILDNSFAPFFAINGAYPSLLLTFAIAYSILKKKEDAVFIGVISGMLQDIFFYNGFGINSLLNLFLCILASIIGESIVKNKRLIPTLSMFVITIVKFFGLVIVLYFMDISIDINIIKLIIMSVYNSIIMFFFYKIISKEMDKNNSNQQWRFK